MAFDMNGDAVMVRHPPREPDGGIYRAAQIYLSVGLDTRNFKKLAVGQTFAVGTPEDEMAQAVRRLLAEAVSASIISGEWPWMS